MKSQKFPKITFRLNLILTVRYPIILVMLFKKISLRPPHCRIQGGSPWGDTVAGGVAGWQFPFTMVSELHSCCGHCNC